MGIYLSGPELVYAGSVFVACGASAYGALIASHARENKRRARQSWRRADKRWAEVHEEMLALEEIKAELAEPTPADVEAVSGISPLMRGPAPTTEAVLREAARQNAWCTCMVIPQHLVKDHPHACSDPECTDPDCTNRHIAEGYTAKVLAFGPLTPDNGRTEGQLVDRLMIGDTCSDCGRPATLVRDDGSRSCSACVESARLHVPEDPDDPWCPAEACVFLGLPSGRHKLSDHERHADMVCTYKMCPVMNEHLVSFAGCVAYKRSEKENPDGR